MPESTKASLAATTFAQFVGSHVMGHVIGGEAHRVYREFLERWRLPRNHDLQIASEEALREAALLLVMELAGRLDPRKPWLSHLIDHVRAGKLFQEPLFDAGNDPHREWVEALCKLVKGQSFKRVHDGIALIEDSVSYLVSFPEVSQNLGSKLADTFVTWARAEILCGQEPPEFELLVRDGWMPDQRGSQRVTLIQAYRLFFREHLKRRPSLYRAVLMDILNEIRQQLPEGNTLPRDLGLSDLERWITPQVGALQGLTSGVSAQIDALTSRHREILKIQSEVLVALTALRTEALAPTQNVISTLRALARES